MTSRKPKVPPRYQELFAKALAGKAKAAIRCHCLMCVGWEPKEVELCTATGCPLYALRSRTAQASTEATDRTKRRNRALASGRRPPKRDPLDGHGAQSDGPTSNAKDTPRPSATLESSASSEAAFGMESNNA